MMSIDTYIHMDMQQFRRLVAQHPEKAENLSNDRLRVYIQALMEERLASPTENGDEAWWDSTHCSVEELKQRLAEQLAKGDFMSVMKYGAMVHIRECADIEADQVTDVR